MLSVSFVKLSKFFFYDIFGFFGTVQVFTLSRLKDSFVNVSTAERNLVLSLNQLVSIHLTLTSCIYANFYTNQKGHKCGIIYGQYHCLCNSVIGI